MKMRSILSIRSWLLALVLVLVPASSFAGIFLSINIAPPPLPIYSQPLCPGDGYIWTPGYWAYGPEGYFWVPGTWVMSPFVGGLWTPGYWGWGDGLYLWHGGYWGTEIGFYGGVNYGYGYGGRGYEGGYWHGDHFNYNRTVNNINVTNIHNVYNKTVINNVNVTRVSYNGGTGGVAVRPTPREQSAVRFKRADALPTQAQHEQAAASNRAQLASVNHGNPAIAATPRPGAFQDRGVVPAGRTANAPASERVAAPRNGEVNTMAPRNANPAGSGRAPLVTAHPNGPQAPANTMHQGQAANTARPEYNAPGGSNNAQPHYNAPGGSNNAQPHYNAPGGNNNAQPHYNAPATHQQIAPPQHQQSMPQSMPREQSAPRPQPAQPQHQQSMPREQSAPHPQAAPQPRSEPHGEHSR